MDAARRAEWQKVMRIPSQIAPLGPSSVRAGAVPLPNRSDPIKRASSAATSSPAPQPQGGGRPSAALNSDLGRDASRKSSARVSEDKHAVSTLRSSSSSSSSSGSITPASSASSSASAPPANADRDPLRHVALGPRNRSMSGNSMPHDTARSSSAASPATVHDHHLDLGSANPRQQGLSPARRDRKTTFPASGSAVRETKSKVHSPRPVASENSDEQVEQQSDEGNVEPQLSLNAPTRAGRLGLKRIQQKLRRLEPNAHEVRQPKPNRAPRFTPQGRSNKTGAKDNVLCVNNKNDPRLRQSGFRLGTPGECVAKGFGSALHQKLEPGKTAAFIRQFSTPYEKIINLDEVLWYKNGPPPPGKHRATLPMCFQKGFGAGSAALARKLKAERSATR